MKNFFLTPLVIFLVIIMMMTAKLLDSASDQENLHMVGSPLPAFDMPAALDNLKGFSNTNMQNGYSLINIFASWCIPCRIEHSFLMELQSQKIKIYGINWKDNKKHVAKWFKEAGNPYVAIGADKNGDVITSLGVTGAPESFLISPDNIILYRHTGILTEDIWKNNFMPLMEPK